MVEVMNESGSPVEAISDESGNGIVESSMPDVNDDPYSGDDIIIMPD